MNDYFEELDYLARVYKEDKEEENYSILELRLYLVIKNKGLGDKTYLAEYNGKFFDNYGEVSCEDITNCTLINKKIYRSNDKNIKDIPREALDSIINLYNNIADSYLNNMKSYEKYPVDRINLDNCFNFLKIISDNAIFNSENGVDKFNVLAIGSNAFCNLINYLCKRYYFNSEFNKNFIMEPFKILNRHLITKYRDCNIEQKFDLFYDEPDDFNCFDLLVSLKTGTYFIRTPSYTSINIFDYLDNPNYMQVGLVNTNNLFKYFADEGVGYIKDIENYLEEIARVATYKEVLLSNSCKALKYLNLGKYCNSSKVEEYNIDNVEKKALIRLYDNYKKFKDNDLGGSKYSFYELCTNIINNISIIIFNNLYELEDRMNDCNKEEKNSLNYLLKLLKMFYI